MNPYANLYLRTADQYRRDLAKEYRNAQRGWASPDFPNRKEYVPVRKHRIMDSLRKLGRRQAPAAVNTVIPLDARVRRIHAA
jgi:hypothetical protein